MGFGNAALTGARVLVVLVALAVIGLGAYVEHTIQDVDARGSAVLETVAISAIENAQWQAFFNVITGIDFRIWLAIAAASFTALAGIMILLSQKVGRLNMSRYISVPLELLSMFASAGAFSAILSFTIKLEPACNSIDEISSTELSSFYMICPITKAYFITTSAGLFLVLITFIATLVGLYHHVHKQNSCSFEPTASGLGMGRGYQTTKPMFARNAIATLYDPRKPAPEKVAEQPREDEEMGLVNAGADMGVGGSVGGRASSGDEKTIRKGMSEARLGDNGVISGVLARGTEEKVRQTRPARPWSEMPKR